MKIHETSRYRKSSVMIIPWMNNNHNLTRVRWRFAAFRLFTLRDQFPQLNEQESVNVIYLKIDCLKINTRSLFEFLGQFAIKNRIFISQPLKFFDLHKQKIYSPENVKLIH